MGKFRVQDSHLLLGRFPFRRLLLGFRASLPPGLVVLLIFLLFLLALPVSPSPLSAFLLHVRFRRSLKGRVKRVSKLLQILPCVRADSLPTNTTEYWKHDSLDDGPPHNVPTYDASSCPSSCASLTSYSSSLVTKGTEHQPATNHHNNNNTEHFFYFQFEKDLKKH